MGLSFYISIISVTVSVLSLLYTFISNRDKFMISSIERKSILEWYEKTNKILVYMKKSAQQNHPIEREVLNDLTSLIDIGRFYFPNNKDNIGLDKPIAYRGHRSQVLDLLVYAYEIGHSEQPIHFQDHLVVLQREFTSEIFKVLKPHKYISYLKRITYLDVKLNKKYSYEDFIGCSNPYEFKFSGDK